MLQEIEITRHTSLFFMGLCFHNCDGLDEFRITFQRLITLAGHATYLGGINLPDFMENHTDDNCFEYPDILHTRHILHPCYQRWYLKIYHEVPIYIAIPLLVDSLKKHEHFPSLETLALGSLLQSNAVVCDSITRRYPIWNRHLKFRQLENEVAKLFEHGSLRLRQNCSCRRCYDPKTDDKDESWRWT